MKALNVLLRSALVLLAGAHSAAAQNWTQLLPSGGPSVARHSHTAVLNATSDRMTIFGGSTVLGHLNDVWVMSYADGLGGSPSWTQLSPSGGPPKGRQDHTAVLDAADNMIVFGGDEVGSTCSTTAVSNDVWVLSRADGVGGASAWTQLSPGGGPPAGRRAPSAVYDSVNNRMVVYGGDADACGSFLDDVWVLTNANGQGGTPTWTQLVPTGDPGARSYHTAVYDPGTNSMILFGGQNSAASLNDVWVLSNANGIGGTPAWTQLAPAGTPPPARSGHSAVYDTATNSMTIFGAAASGFSNDVWTLSNANGHGGTPTWTQLSPAGGLPPPRRNSSAVFNPGSNRMTIYAGQASNGSDLLDTWVLGTFGISLGGLSLSEIRPTVGGTNGSVTVTILGSGFMSGAVAKLGGLGPDIVGTNTAILNTNVIRCTFDLRNAEPGLRSLVVTNPDTTSTMMSGAFTVEQGGSPQVQVDIIGPNLVRIGREQTFLLAVRNSGNVDAGPGLVSLSVPPTIQYVQESGADLFSAGVTSSLEYGIPSPTNNGNPNLLFATAGIPAGSSQSAPVQLTLPVGAVPASGSSFTLTASWQQDLSDMSLDDFLGFEKIPFIALPTAGCAPCGDSYYAELGAYLNVYAPYAAYQTAKHNADVAVAQLAVFLGFAAVGLGATQLEIPPLAGLGLGAGLSLIDACVENLIGDDTCLPSVENFLTTTKSAIIGCLPPSPINNCLGGITLPPSVVKALTVLDLLLDGAINATNVYLTNGQRVSVEKAAFMQLQLALGIYSSKRAAYQACLSPTQCSVPPPPPLPPNPPGTISLPVTGVTALDPNEKVGTRGAGAQQYVSGTVPLSYAVYFTNESTATAPAQHVVITDQLDLTHDSVSTFGFGPITFGSQLVAPPPGLTNYSTSVDLRPTNNLLVQVDAHLDPSTGLLTWSFASLDPATNQPPTDPTAGFLPPGGEGSVFFTVLPKQGLATNTQINNQATIVFDVNPPMSTQTWLNTIDNTPPTSQVVALPVKEFSTTFAVNWTGADVGAGVQDFTIYVSDNGNPFSPFQTNTAATSATFTGQDGHTYGFYSLARDLVDNVEAAKTTAEATTVVSVDLIPPTTTAVVSPLPNVAGWNNSNVTVNLASVDNPGGSGVKQITYSATGAQNIASTVVAGASTSLTITNEGTTTITFFGTDNVGNIETVRTVTINIDKTPPTVSCSARPNTLWPPNNKLVPVNLSVTVTDSLSGPAGFNLVSVTSNEPDSGFGDIQGFVIGTPSISGQLRVQRLGNGTGRVYTFTYSGSDRASNSASCTTTVSVPHDQGH